MERSILCAVTAASVLTLGGVAWKKNNKIKTKKCLKAAAVALLARAQEAAGYREEKDQTNSQKLQLGPDAEEEEDVELSRWTCLGPRLDSIIQAPSQILSARLATGFAYRVVCFIPQPGPQTLVFCETQSFCCVSRKRQLGWCLGRHLLRLWNGTLKELSLVAPDVSAVRPG